MAIFKPYTDVQVNEHEAKVGGKRNLREITISDEDTQFVFLIKRPSRAVIQAVTEANSKNNINGASKILLGCVLEGDMEAVENDGAIFLALIESITALLGGVKSEIKKI